MRGRAPILNVAAIPTGAHPMTTGLRKLLAVCFAAGFFCSTAYAETTADALFAAIRAQDVPTIDRILTTEPSLASATDERGRSAVMIALFLTTGESFLSPPRNAPLQALLEHEPALSFFESCGTGNRDQVRAALARDASLASAWHPIGLSALHFAAFSGDAATTALLLDRGAAIDARARNVFLNTPLQVALLGGNEATARVLLERGADPQVRQHLGFAPIHQAALLGRRDLVDLLLEKGADIDARGNDGRNAITEAIRGGRPELADYLRARGAREVAITADLFAAPE
jgi:ankyrin repeat protein